MRNSRKLDSLASKVVAYMNITKKIPINFMRSVPDPKAEEKKKAKLDEKKAKKEKAIQEAKDRVKITWLVGEWVKIMAHLGFDNKLDETFSLRDIEVKSYGFKCRVEAAPSLTYATLEEEKTVNIIQDNLKCLFVGKRGKKGKFEVQFITEEIGEIDFEPIPIKPYELYLGTSIDGEPVIVSMLKYPHILIQGATNMGKTKMIDCFLTN
jgi:S-DNA-T family DNA segregation ATPase FtsK/SpoIIIE